MSRDPVCGMKVAEAAAREAGRFSKCQSATFYFCNDGCKKRFDANPAQFLNASQPPRSHPAVASGVSLDPVCGMKVTEAKARAAKRFSDLAGRTYFFCNDSCKEEFDANPARFVKNVIRESPPDD